MVTRMDCEAVDGPTAPALDGLTWSACEVPPEEVVPGAPLWHAVSGLQQTDTEIKLVLIAATVPDPLGDDEIAAAVTSLSFE
jgi:hypothetical protein